MNFNFKNYQNRKVRVFPAKFDNKLLVKLLKKDLLKKILTKSICTRLVFLMFY